MERGVNGEGGEEEGGVGFMVTEAPRRHCEVSERRREVRGVASIGAGLLVRRAIRTVRRTWRSAVGR